MQWVGLARLLGACALAAACGSSHALPRHEPACAGAVCAADGGKLSDAQAASADGDTERDDAGGPHGARDGAVPAATGPGKVIAEPQDEASYVFDQTQVRTYNIVIAPADLSTLNLNPAAEQYVPATLEHEGKRYGPLGVRYKGGVGAFLSPCTTAVIPGDVPGPKLGKCSIKLDFNHVADDARFYGLKQLNFHSMNFDPAQLRDRLGYALYREAGVAAPRAMHARVLINGKLEGLFLAVEQVDGRFTRGRFSEGGEGNLYKEVWPLYSTADVYERALETNTQAPAVAKMLAFKQAVDQGSAAIGSWLDRNYMLRYFAVDRVIENDDGVFHWYCKAGVRPEADIWNHNFYWYEAEHAQRMWLVPWDLDNSFAGHPYVHIESAWNAAPGLCLCWGNPAQRPASCDPLTAEFASWDADYQQAVAAFIAGPFADVKVTAKLDAWSQQLREAVQEAGGLGGAPLLPVWELAVAGLRDTVKRERANHGFAY